MPSMSSLLPLESGVFGSVAGLPVHPLVVHAAVVLLPLSAAALIALVFVPRWRKAFGWLTMAGLAVGTVAAYVAKESGEALAAEIGLPADHARWGDLLPVVAAMLFVAASAWFWLQRRASETSTRSVSVLVTGIASVILATASIVLTVVVGHSGAQAVWAGEVSSEPAASPSASGPATAAAAAATYSLAQVTEHATAADCWTAISGTVYDLTDWEGRHPGGQQPIVGLCGTDGTAAFLAQHDSQKEPAQDLAEFAIGTLSGSPATTSPSPTAAATKPGYTMAEVKKHATAASCWSVVDGNVYDLTDWVDSHPGGRARILSMCGRDGTAAFRDEHGKEAEPNATLKGYKIGPLA